MNTLHVVKCYDCQESYTLTEEEYDALEDHYHCGHCALCRFCGHLLGDEIGYHAACRQKEDCGCRYEYGILQGPEQHPEEPGSGLGVYRL